MNIVGQVNKQVFIKHGSFDIRVHRCILQLVKPASRTEIIATEQISHPKECIENNEQQTLQQNKIAI